MTPTFLARRPANVSRACAGVRSRGPPAKITPRYSTPAASAYSASTDRVRPQILMSVATRAPRHPGERARRLDEIRSGRDARSDQHRIGARGRIAFHVLSNAHPALGDGQQAGGDSRDEPFRRRWIDDEGLEIAIVDPDHRRAALERAVELRLVAHFDQHFEVQTSRRIDHLMESVGSQRSRDE